MTGLHNQVTNRPTVVVHDKINDMADHPFAGLDGVAAKSLCALQMKIVACLLTRNKMQRRWSLGENARAPRFASTLILLYILSPDRRLAVQARGTFYRLPSRHLQQGEAAFVAGF